MQWIVKHSTQPESDCIQSIKQPMGHHLSRCPIYLDNDRHRKVHLGHLAYGLLGTTVHMCICKYTCGQSPGGHDGWVPGFFKKNPTVQCVQACMYQPPLTRWWWGWLILDFGKINACTVGFRKKEYLCSHVHSILLEDNTTNSTTLLSVE